MSQSSQPKRAQSMGVATFYMMVSELVFILSNYLLHIILARQLGVEMYGIFGLLMSLYLFNRAFLNTGIPKAVAKFLSETKVNAQSLIKTSFRLQVILGISLSLIYILSAGFLASFLKEPLLKGYLILLGVIVFPLALNSLYPNGYLNGLRLFRQQFILRVGYPFLRMILVVVLVFLGFQLWGVLTGYLLAAVVSFLAGAWLLQRNLPQKSGPARAFSSGRTFGWVEILKFSLPVTVAALALTLVRNLNTFLVKYFLVSNELMGYYTAALTLSQFPFMVFSVVAITLMPSVSRAFSAGKVEQAKKYLSGSLRYLLLLLFPCLALITATSEKLVVLFYPPDYLPAAPVFTLLALGSGALAVFTLLASVITGSGRPKVEMGMTIIILAALFLISWLLIPKLGLIGAAWSFLSAALIALLAALAYTYGKWKTLVGLSSFLKITALSLLIFILASFWQYSGILLLVNYFALFSIYLLFLYLFGEIRKEDWLFVQKIFKRRAKTGEKGEKRVE